MKGYYRKNHDWLFSIVSRHKKDDLVLNIRKLDY